MARRTGRRHFTKEYKAEVVRFVQTSPKSIGQLAKELDLTETSLRSWVKQAATDERRERNGPLTTEERAEVARLRRELKRVTMERDILKKATALFARNG
jgi:transposase